MSDRENYLLEHYGSEKKLEQKATRDGFGKALVELGQTNPLVVGLSADLVESTRMEEFALANPDRFFEVGVAEQNMMGIAAGLALAGKIPFITSYATFSPGRNWDQLRVSVCYAEANVKIIGCHSGLSVGPDGATHQALEDIAITRVLPNLLVLAPADANEAHAATIAAANYHGPVYIRLGREASPVFLQELPFEIGKIKQLTKGHDVTIVTCGSVAYEAVQAAEMLSDEGIKAEILLASSIKPFDTAALLESVSKTRAVVTVEEHQISGGLGGVVAEILAEELPTAVERVGMPNSFGESGPAMKLWQKYGLDRQAVREAVKRVLGRKKRKSK